MVDIFLTNFIEPFVVAHKYETRQNPIDLLIAKWYAGQSGHFLQKSVLYHVSDDYLNTCVQTHKIKKSADWNVH